MIARDLDAELTLMWETGANFPALGKFFTKFCMIFFVIQKKTNMLHLLMPYFI